MKTFTVALSALVALFAGVSAQDESGAHDGLLPLTTIPLVNAAGSTTGSETSFATAITTSTIPGGLTTIYSDRSGIVTGTSTSPSASAATITSTGSETMTASPSVTVLSGGHTTSTSTSSGSVTKSTSTFTSTSTSGTKSSSSSAANASSSGSASGSSAGDRIVVSGLGLVGAVVAGLIVM